MAAETAVTAFAADDILDRSLWLPEIRADEPFAAPVAIGFHLVDCVAHGWDVAAGIGVEAEFEPDLVAAALSIAEQVPTGAAREAPDAAFGPVLPRRRRPIRPRPGATPARTVTLVAHVGFDLTRSHSV